MAEKLREKLLRKIITNNSQISVNNKMTFEITDYSFIIPDNLKYELNKIEKKYVKDKLKKYRRELDRCIKLLKNDLYSRQAVIPFNQTTPKPECFISIQFLIRKYGILHCIVTSRSLNVKKCLYQDIEICRQFCKILYDKLCIRDTIIKFNVGSLHFYEDDK